ncbi:hypothetical protein DPMN_032050 [Dreissena polymorpha]|uniref:Uncharacterized protein n=1 Tax=Dreissena polymorpha TaxID=45954 RepID=A0A9D4M144_DREPO|nr:hypothetical protein DPMN_032050 [Dreissena polymorpha]
MHVEYYMIPEKNLLAACGMRDQQLTWIATITDMINEGPRIQLRFPKIRRAIFAHPEPPLRFSMVKTELELVILINMIRLIHSAIYGVSTAHDSLFQEIQECFDSILMNVLPPMNLDDMFNITLGLFW